VCVVMVVQHRYRGAGCKLGPLPVVTLPFEITGVPEDGGKFSTRLPAVCCMMYLTDPACGAVLLLLAASPFLLSSRMDSTVGEAFTVHVSFFAKDAPVVPSEGSQPGCEGLVRLTGRERSPFNVQVPAGFLTA
jgi:hypothetical protein